MKSYYILYAFIVNSYSENVMVKCTPDTVREIRDHAY